jgi:NNP family nitrate/nitrite transporter-like MFS transporter
MRVREFLSAGHFPTLISAFLYFDMSFMVWMLIGALASFIGAEFGLTDAQKGVMVALPILGGAVSRLLFGFLADRMGGRRTGILGLGLTLLPLLFSWLWVDSFSGILVAGLLLGVAGASFAVALPLASRWYPARYQGLVMGIAGAGNSGTVVAALFGPLLAEYFGWHAVFAVAAGAIFLTLVVFTILSKDSPDQPPPKQLADYWRVLLERDVGWFALFYTVTFGGFVGLASFLGIFYHEQYELNRVTAGSVAALCVVGGSFLRPVGGYLADRFGGIRVLTVLYVSVGLAMLALSMMPPLASSTAVMFVGMGMLGMGNGSVFQLVPQRFGREIGIVTGIVGAAGGFGGFLLPILFGSLKQLTGSFSGGLFIFSMVAFGCAGALLHVSRAWEGALAGVSLADSRGFRS